MSAAAAFNNRIRLEGGANVLAAAQAAGVRRYLRQSIAFWAIPGPGLADEERPLAFDASPAVAAGARVVTELCPFGDGSLLESRASRRSLQTLRPLAEGARSKASAVELAVITSAPYWARAI